MPARTFVKGKSSNENENQNHEKENLHTFDKMK